MVSNKRVDRTVKTRTKIIVLLESVFSYAKNARQMGDGFIDYSWSIKILFTVTGDKFKEKQSR